MQTTIGSIGRDVVTLESGASIAADMVVLATGVRPRTGLAEAAGLPVKRGILVDRQMETPVAGIFAAGDVARWPGGADGETMRVEHWVVAQRQGQVAAENMLGAAKPFRDAPFFRSAHNDTAIRYVGHAETRDEIVVAGDIAARDAKVSYRRDGRTLAIATIGRDIEALEAGRRLAGAM